MKIINSNSIFALLMIAGLMMAFQAKSQQMNGNGRHNGMQGNMGPMMQHYEAIPNLTDDQKQKIDQLNLSFDKNTLQTRNDIREKEAHLHTLMTQDNTDAGQIDKLIDDIGGLRTKIRKERVSTDLKIRNLLTDDQKVIFDSRGMHGRQAGRWGRS
jgi:Spy/CpxP family protein refolding chaperone